MVALSISIEAQFGLTWPRWKRLVTEIEALGFAGLFRSDHFTVNAQPPDDDSLELIVSLTYLADHTSRVHFGPLVAPLSFRDPVMLARQAAALDNLSGGRMILGVGAGWMEREHIMFGYPLGDVPTRIARLTEGLEVITRLLRTSSPVSYSGHFYRLHEGMLLPRPQRPGGPPLLIGGNGPKRTLPLVARYADIWNGDFLTPEMFRERTTLLDELLRAEGRQPRDVKRTLTVGICCGRTPAEYEQRVQRLRQWIPDFADTPLETLLEILRTEWHALVGPPEAIIEQIAAYAAAGVEELVLHWVELQDTEGLHVLAEHVLAHLPT